jgi:hypothetical protein
MSAPQRHRAIPASVPEENVTVSPLDLHMEMFDMRSGNVWLCQQPLTMDEYRAFKPEPPYVKSGIARSAMSFAYFRRSPGAQCCNLAALWSAARLQAATSCAWRDR